MLAVGERDVLVNRYAETIHLELRQNAEDALKRRSSWNGSREVLFELESDEPAGCPFRQSVPRSKM